MSGPSMRADRAVMGYGSWGRRRRAPAPRLVLLQELRLVGAGKLSGQVHVAGEGAVAGHRMWLAADRVLEDGRLELLRRRRLATRGQRDRPVDGETGVVVAGGHGEHLEVGVARL